MSSSAAAIGGGLALALLFAVIAYVARRGLHPAIEGLVAGAAIAIATNVIAPIDIFALGNSAWNRIAIAAALIAEYAVARAAVRSRWP